MFEKLRKPGRAKNLFAYVIFGAICLTFVFMGLGGGFGIASGGSAAVVNNGVITISDYQEGIRRIENQYRTAFQGMPAAQRQNFTARIRKQVMSGLIQEELLSQLAHDVGIRTADKEVLDYLVSIPAFNKNGRFLRDNYDQYLKNTRTTSADFESRIRRSLKLGRLRGLFVASVISTDEELKKQSEATQTTLNVEYIELDRNNLKAQLKAKPSEVTNYLAKEDNKKKVEEYYEKNKAEFSEKEQVRARHILVKFKAGDKASENKALAKIKEIKGKTVVTKDNPKAIDFGELAAKHSEDIASKVKRGDLGFFTRGKMVKEFENTAFGSPVGEISEPVKTTYGYHLIKVEERKGGGAKALGEVRNEIVENLLAESKYNQVVDKVKNFLKEGKSSQLLSFLKSQNIKWQETGEFDLGRDAIPKIGDNDKVYESILALSAPGVMSSEIVQSRGKSYVFKLKNIGKPKQVTAKKTKEGLQMDSRSANEAFSSWAESQQKLAKIKVNPRFASEEAAQ